MACFPFVDRKFDLNFPSDGNWVKRPNPLLGITEWNDITSTTKAHLLVYLDGASRGNGTSKAIASYGTYFGRNSPYSRCFLLPNDESQTNQSAELFAVSVAIKTLPVRDNYHSKGGGTEKSLSKQTRHTSSKYSQTISGTGKKTDTATRKGSKSQIMRLSSRSIL